MTADSPATPAGDSNPCLMLKVITVNDRGPMAAAEEGSAPSKLVTASEQAIRLVSRRPKVMKPEEGTGWPAARRAAVPFLIRSPADRIMFMVDDVDDVVTRLRSHGADSWARSRSTRTFTGSASCAALRASSSGCPSSSAEPMCGRGRALAGRSSLHETQASPAQAASQYGGLA